MKLVEIKKHLIPSLIGFIKYFFKEPSFSIKLVLERLKYFLNRSYVPCFKDPHGYVIDNSHTIVSYWTFFVEGELRSPLWESTLDQVGQPLLLDVGANNGVFAHYLLSTFKGVKVKSFEPMSEMEEKLQTVQEIWGQERFEYVMAACSNEEGFARIYKEHAGDARASLDQNTTEDLSLYEEVQTKKLDHLITESVHLLKIDVEGFEIQVLEGAKEVVSQVRYVIAEANDAESEAKLDDFFANNSKTWMKSQVGATDFLFAQVSD